MNCSLCKYRVQIVGFEEQVGAPQRAHHMQVRGLLGSARPADEAKPVPDVDTGATETRGDAGAADANAGGAETRGEAKAADANAGGAETRGEAKAADANAGGAETRGEAKTANANAGGAETRGEAKTANANAGDAQKSSPQVVGVSGRQALTGASGPTAQTSRPYEPHPIEAASFKIIAAGRDWSGMPEGQRRVAQRLVHTSGDFGIVDELFFSHGAVEIGVRALLRCRRIVTDVTMVSSGLKRSLLQQLDMDVWCGVHDRETHLLAENAGITRSAAGMRRAWEKWGNDIVLAIGDAPTAIVEATRLIRELGWRPQLVVGLPVGFVGTRESKDDLRRCLQVPRITNSGTRGGSPWAASVINAMMIGAVDYLAGVWSL
jgi:precorrin isomerase